MQVALVLDIAAAEADILERIITQGRQHLALLMQRLPPDVSALRIWHRLARCLAPLPF